MKEENKKKRVSSKGTTYQKLHELYKEKVQLSIIQMEQMLSDNDYADWLERFTNRKESFNSNDVAYCNEESSKTDKENIGNLELLFSGINRYCRGKGICPQLEPTGSYYLMQYNYIGYQIGYRANPYIGIYYCNRVKEHVDETYIDFNDIKLFVKEGGLSDQKPKQLKKI